MISSTTIRTTYHFVINVIHIFAHRVAHFIYIDTHFLRGLAHRISWVLQQFRSDSSKQINITEICLRGFHWIFLKLKNQFHCLFLIVCELKSLVNKSLFESEFEKFCANCWIHFKSFSALRKRDTSNLQLDFFIINLILFYHREFLPFACLSPLW